MAAGKIYISSKMVKKLGIPLDKTVNIRAGNTVTSATLVVSNKKRNTYTLSPELLKNLHLVNYSRLQLRYDRNTNQIHIGPIIGILSSFLPNRDVFDPKSIQAELIFLSKIGKLLPAHIFIFTPSSINWHNMTTRGYYYSNTIGLQGRWVSSVFPLPDVVYNRIPSRAIEIQKNLKNTKKMLMSLPYLKFFNPSFLNKWIVHQYLYTNLELHPFLPETRLLNKINLTEMLQIYDDIYLKPSNGSLGRGIIKASINSQGKIIIILYGRRKSKESADNPQELLKKTRKYRKGKDYIVQQGLNLMTYKGCPFDIRTIVQKNNRGEWQIAKKFVRVAPRGSSISNLSSGGSAEKARSVFDNIYKEQQLVKDKNIQINNLCQIVAATLEKSSNQVYGELGLDIGLDKNGNPWLIEVNSKPRKSTITNFSQKIVTNSFKRPLEYAIYLAGF